MRDLLYIIQYFAVEGVMKQDTERILRAIKSLTPEAKEVAVQFILCMARDPMHQAKVVPHLRLVANNRNAVNRR